MNSPNVHVPSKWQNWKNKIKSSTFYIVVEFVCGLCLRLMWPVAKFVFAVLDLLKIG